MRIGATMQPFFNALKTLLLFGFSICLSPTLSADLVTISTLGSTSGSIGQFGENTSGTPATFGQTFIVPANSPVLDEVACFTTQNTNLPDAFDFSFHVAAWNGFRVDGPILYSSAPMSTTNNGGAGGAEEFRFDVETELVTGNKYIAFLTPEGHFDGLAGTVSVAIAGSATSYSGGEFVHTGRLNDFDALSTTTWDFNSSTNSTGFDTHFEMTFVPEPSSLLMLALVMLFFTVRLRGKFFTARSATNDEPALST